MNLTEIAEEAVSLWTCCESAYKNRYEKPPSDEVLLLLFDRAHHQLISKGIDEARQSVPSKQKEERAEPASDKQMQYIIDLGGDAHWTGTKKEASKYIEDLRK